MWVQKTLQLQPRRRGFHLVTDEVVRQLPELQQFRVGVAQLFIQHTSAGLALNENADRTVRTDMEAFLDRCVPDDLDYFAHVTEGADDMPAHVKAVLVGANLTLPIAQGRLALGTWQGIWLGEFRNDGGPRRLVATLNGE